MTQNYLWAAILLFSVTFPFIEARMLLRKQNRKKTPLSSYLIVFLAFILSSFTLVFGSWLISLINTVFGFPRVELIVCLVSPFLFHIGVLVSFVILGKIINLHKS